MNLQKLRLNQEEEENLLKEDAADWIVLKDDKTLGVPRHVIYRLLSLGFNYSAKSETD